MRTRNKFKPKFNRFDILEAYYVYLSQMNPDPWTLEYLKFDTVQRYLTPSPSLSYNSLTPNGRLIYNLIESKDLMKDINS